MTMDVYIGNELCTHRLVFKNKPNCIKAAFREIAKRGIAKYETMDLGTYLAIYWV
jgi:hypothetical protein